MARPVEAAPVRIVGGDDRQKLILSFANCGVSERVPFKMKVQSKTGPPSEIEVSISVLECLDLRCERWRIHGIIEQSQDLLQILPVWLARGSFTANYNVLNRTGELRLVR